MPENQSLHLPVVLLDDEPAVLTAYALLARLAIQSGGRDIVLPGRDARARMYGVSNKRAVEIERRLESLNLVALQSPGGNGYKQARRRIIIRYVVTSTGTAEFLEQRPAVVFSDDLAALKRSCRLRDVQRRTLADFSDQELYTISGGASESDIRTALVEVESFKPKSRGAIHSILKVFAARFVNGKLRADRPGRIEPARPVETVPDNENILSQVNRANLYQALELDANFYPPDENHKIVDTVAAALAAGNVVPTEKMPLTLSLLAERRRNLFERSTAGVSLSPAARIEKRAPGYYSIRGGA